MAFAWTWAFAYFNWQLSTDWLALWTVHQIMCLFVFSPGKFSNYWLNDTYEWKDGMLMWHTLWEPPWMDTWTQTHMCLASNTAEVFSTSRWTGWPKPFCHLLCALSCRAADWLLALYTVSRWTSTHFEVVWNEELGRPEEVENVAEHVSIPVNEVVLLQAVQDYGLCAIKEATDSAQGGREERRGGKKGGWEGRKYRRTTCQNYYMYV